MTSYASSTASISNKIWEFFIFGIKQARACVFAGSFFILLFASHHIPLFGLYRYDFLFIAAIVLQVILVALNIETKDEMKVIFLFHIIGLVLELYKTHPAIGSWSYPEAGIVKIAGVPLYSGFMYAAVGSYISQAWRIFKLDLSDYRYFKQSLFLAFFIYLNFFTNHFIYDFRWILILLVFLIFKNTTVYFTVTKKRRSMPLPLSFFLIAFFIWVAENMATFLGAWKYSYQLTNWSVVSFHKITSWYLLVIISFIIIADLKFIKKNMSKSDLASK